MKKTELLENLRPKEVFDHFRKRQSDRFPLRLRMTLTVAVALIISGLLALAIAALLHFYFGSNIQRGLPVVLILTSVIFGTGLTAILSKYFFDPIHKLIRAMECIADGDFSIRLEDQSTSRELMEVYSGFNMMAHELGAMEMLQSDFVSNVSHEFKTPINAIEGYSTLLQGNENLSPDQQQYVEKILFNTHRLSSLVSSILLLSKLENQQLPGSPATYRLDEQIRQSIVAREPEWEKKDIEFDVEMDCIEYTGNEAMMRHVWDNLIGNAIKFDPNGGLLRIRLTEDTDTIRFTVDDSGPGLSEEAQKRIFDKFYQADPSHKEEGNGLGLALVKRILTLESGTVQAENLPAGGCRFTVLLQK